MRGCACGVMTEDGEAGEGVEEQTWEWPRSQKKTCVHLSDTSWRSWESRPSAAETLGSS